MQEQASSWSHSSYAAITLNTFLQHSEAKPRIKVKLSHHILLFKPKWVKRYIYNSEIHGHA